VIGNHGAGVLLYLAQEGRGIGLINKLKAYELQDQGFDTIQANERLGFEADERVFAAAAEMLKQLGYTRVRLLTNNPDKVEALTRFGIEIVERVPKTLDSLPCLMACRLRGAAYDHAHRHDDDVDADTRPAQRRDHG